MAFLLLMLAGAGGVVGFFLLFGMMLGTIPFLIAGREVGQIIGIVFEMLFVAALLGRQVWRALRAETQGARDRALNWLAFGVLVVASLALSLVILEREWPG